MVSSVLHLTSAQLVVKLEQFRDIYADDAEYQELRKQFPTDWPVFTYTDRTTYLGGRSDASMVAHWGSASGRPGGRGSGWHHELLGQNAAMAQQGNVEELARRAIERARAARREFPSRLASALATSRSTCPVRTEPMWSAQSRRTTAPPRCGRS